MPVLVLAFRFLPALPWQPLRDFIRIRLRLGQSVVRPDEPESLLGGNPTISPGAHIFDHQLHLPKRGPFRVKVGGVYGANAHLMQFAAIDVVKGIVVDEYKIVNLLIVRQRVLFLHLLNLHLFYQ